MSSRLQKLLGQYATPPEVVGMLMGWLVRSSEDVFLDPSCGDGRFLGHHAKAVGVDFSTENCLQARHAVPSATVHEGDFFAWASSTRQRFDAVGGNPPFIRYQNFSGEMRRLAGQLAAAMGARFSGLASSWAPFIVAAAGLLKEGGRLAFVVPAEIGHSTYAGPVISSLCTHFHMVTVTAVREKLFPQLSEDAWILHADGFGGRTDRIGFCVRERLETAGGMPEAERWVSLADWERNGCRLRRYLLPRELLGHYEALQSTDGVSRLRDEADVGIGYVTGANDFFHLKPSQVDALGVPEELCRVAIRKAEQLPDAVVNRSVVDSWLRRDLPVLLLDLSGGGALPAQVAAYLRSEHAEEARRSYKCRIRDPWYVVPGVVVPDGFLSYMSGKQATLVRNAAHCVCTNSVHAVRLRGSTSFAKLQKAWEHPISRLSQELEGHPLGGGLLKLEPGEAGRVLVPLSPERVQSIPSELLWEGVQIARHWRHYS